MDAVWSYLERSPMLVIALLLVVAYLFTRVTGGGDKSKAQPEDLVPHYKRFERREPEFGDRRKAKTPVDVEEDQRKGPRRG